MRSRRGDAGDEIDEQPLLVGKMQVHRALGDTRPRRDVLHAGRRETALRKAGEGGGEDLGAALLGVSFLPLSLCHSLASKYD